MKTRAMIRNIFTAIAFFAIVENSYTMIDRYRRISDTCGVPKIEMGLIIRGQDFQRGSFPWIVALTHLDYEPPKFFCAGTLISKTFVISGKLFSSNTIIMNSRYADVSAAHCIHQKQATDELLARNVLAIFGAHNLANSYEPQRYSVSPKKIHIHKEWNHLTRAYDADISLLEFEAGSIHFNTFVQPICPLDAENVSKMTEGTVIGWGKSENPNNYHENIPKLINTIIQTNEKCLPGQGDLAVLSSERTFCAGLRNGSGVCSGDSGGGLFFKVDEVYYLKGIVSSSLLKDDGCDTSRNAIYTNVPEYMDWIREITKNSWVTAPLQTSISVYTSNEYELNTTVLSEQG